MERIEVNLSGRTARVFRAGSGKALLLVHGGWGGAQMTWSRVWEELSATYHVIAPDMPGIGATDQHALSSVREYADWLAELLDVFGIEKAWCVGSSFGASVAWSLAGRRPACCAGLVLVNGFELPATPAVLRELGQLRAARWLMRTFLSQFIYTEGALTKAFVNAALIPQELRDAVPQAWPLIVPRYTKVLIAGDGAPAPRVTPHLLWGEDDRLPGTSREQALRLQQRLAGSTLRFVEGAGHFPQLEKPKEFVRELSALIS